MRALVTGASGLLGRRLTQMLAGRGVPVTVLARESSDLRPLRGVEMRVVRGELTDLATAKEAVRGCTHVFHCAACRAEMQPERVYFDANVLGTGMLLEAARRERRMERFVHVSTVDVYGFPRQPGEEGGELVDAGLPAQRSRLQGEMAVWEYAEEGLPVTVVRPGTIFGPRSRDAVVDVVRRLRQHRLLLVDGGRARGGFTYVDNAACAVAALGASAEAAGQAYNLTDGTGVTWREYVEGLAEGLCLRPPGADLPFGLAMTAARAAELAHTAMGLPGAPPLTRQRVYAQGRDREFVSGRLVGRLGPRIEFAEGLRRTVSWVRSVEGMEPERSRGRMRGFSA